MAITGTRRGELAGIAATGEEMVINGINLIEVRDGKIVSVRGLSDQLLLMRQIGAVHS